MAEQGARRGRVAEVREGRRSTAEVRQRQRLRQGGQQGGEGAELSAPGGDTTPTVAAATTAASSTTAPVTPWGISDGISDGIGNVAPEIAAEIAPEIAPELSRARTAPAGLRQGFQAAC